MPEMLDRIGVDRMKDQDHGGEKRSRPDQGLDPDQLGAHHLLHQCMLKLGGYRRALPLVSPQPQHFHSLSFRDGPKDQTSGVQLYPGESRDSKMCNSTS